MKLKRVIAFFLSLAMVSGLMVMPVSAYDDTQTALGSNSPDRANMIYEYLGTSSTLTGVSLSNLDNDKANFTWSAGDYLWVGVKWKDLNRIEEIFNPVGANDGLAHFNAAVLYDENYLSFAAAETDDMFKVVADTYKDGQYHVSAAADADPFPTDNYDAYMNHYDDYGGGWELITENTLGESNTDDLKIAYYRVEDTNGKNASKKRAFQNIDSSTTDEFMMMAFAFKMGSTEPPANYKVYQGWVDNDNTGFAIGAAGDIAQYDFNNTLGGTEDVGSYFNINDDSVVPTNGTGGPTVKSPTVSPSSATYDKNPNGTDHTFMGDDNRSFTYAARDGAALDKITITDPGGNTSDLASSNYTRTDTPTGSEITILSSYMDTLADAAVGNYTLTFVQESTGAVAPDPTATLAIEKTVDQYSINIKTAKMESGENLVLTHEEYEASTDSYVTKTDTTITSNGTNAYTLDANVEYTLTATYNDKVSWTTPTSTGGATQFAPSTSTCIFTVDGSDPGINGYQIDATFGIAPTTLTTTAGSNGSLSVTGDGLTSSSTSPYNLTPTETYTVKATPDKHYKFNGWSGEAGDITSAIAADTTGSISFTATDGVASEITASFTAMTPSTLTTSVSPASSGTIYVAEDTNTAAASSGTVNMYEDSTYTVTYAPAAGYKFDSWTNDTAPETNSSITYTNPTANHTVAATFVQKTAATVDKPTITYDKNTGGDVVIQYTPNDYPLTGVTNGTGATYTSATTPFNVTIPASVFTSKATNSSFTLTFTNADGISEPTTTVNVIDSSSYAVTYKSGPTKAVTDYTHGETLDLAGLVVEVTTGDGTTEYTFDGTTWNPKAGDPTQTTDPEFSLKYGTTGDAVANGTDVMRLNAPTGDATKKARNGETIKITATAGGATGKNASTPAIAVAKKKLTLNSTITGSPNKTYDGTKALGSGVTAVGVTLDSGSPLVDGDSVTFTGATAQYDSASAYNGTAVETNQNDITVSYTLPTTGDAQNYEIQKINQGNKGTISPAPITITAIKNIPDGTKNVAVSSTSSSAALDGTQATYTGTIHKHEGSTVSLSVDYNYAYNAPTAATTSKTFNIPDETGGSVTATALKSGGSVNTNYTIANTLGAVTDAKIKINDQTPTSISVVGVKDTYTYSDFFDVLSNFKVTANYSSGSPVKETDPTKVKFLLDGTTTELTAGTTVMDVPTHGGGTHTVVVEYEGVKSSPIALTVNPINVKLKSTAPTTGAKASKEYDSTDAANKSDVTLGLEVDGDATYASTYGGKLSEIAIDDTYEVVKYDDPTVANADYLKVTGVAIKANTGFDKSNFTLTNSGTLDTAAGTAKIVARPIKVTAITDIEAVDQYTITPTGNYTATKNGGTGVATATYEYAGLVAGTTGGAMGSDNPEVTFDYDYTPANVAVAGAKSDVAVSNVVGGTGFTGANPNYTLVPNTSLTKGSGTVSAVTYETDFDLPAKAFYTYIDDDKLDMSGAKVTVRKKNSSGTVLSTDEYVATGSGSAYTWTKNGDATAESTVPFKVIWVNASNADGGEVQQQETLKPSEKNGFKIQAVHNSDTAANPVRSAAKSVVLNKTAQSGALTIAPKVIDKVKAAYKTADIANKVYNANKDLLTQDKNNIKYTPYYTSSGTDVEVTGFNVTADPEYKEATVQGGPGTNRVKFSNLRIVGTSSDFSLSSLRMNGASSFDDFALASTGGNFTISSVSAVTTDDLTDNTTLPGTIEKRKITVNVSTVPKIKITATDKKVDLTPISNYASVTSTYNATGTSTAESATSVAPGTTVPALFTVSATYTEDPLTKGTGKAVTLSNVLNDTTNFELEVKGTPTGEVEANNKTLTVTANHATVEVYEGTDTTDTSKKVSGSSPYSIPELMTHSLKITPDAGYHFEKWTSSDISTVNNSTSATPSFQITADSAVTAVVKQLPVWNPSAPTSIDKNAATVTWGYAGDYNPDASAAPSALTINGTNIPFTVNPTAKTISIAKADLAAIPITATGDTVPVTLKFDGAPTGNDTLTADVAVVNNAKSTYTLSPSPTLAYTQLPATKAYGDAIDLTGLTFTVTITKDSEATITDTYTFNTTTKAWDKSRVVGTNPAVNTPGVTLSDDGLAVAWSKAALGAVADAQGAKLTPDYKDATINVTLTPPAGSSSTVAQTAKTAPFVVGKKALTYTVAGNVSREYNGTVDITGTDLSGITVTINGAETADNITIKPNSKTAKFTDDRHVDTNKPIEVKWEITSSTLTDAEIADRYSGVSASDLVDTSLTGTVTPKTVTIDEVIIPSIKSTTASPYASNKSGTMASLLGTTIKLASGTGNTVYSVDSGDINVAITSQYSDVTPDEPGTQHTFTDAAGGALSGGTYNHAVTYTDAAITPDYNFVWPTAAAKVHGTVTDNAINKITITQQPKQTVSATKAVHGDKVDLTGLTVDIEYDDSAANKTGIVYGSTDWNNLGLQVIWGTGGTISGYTGTVDPATQILRRDDHDNKGTIKVTDPVSGTTSADSDKFIVDKRPLNLTVVPTVSKMYDGDNTLPSDAAFVVTIAPADEAKIPTYDSTNGITNSNVEVTPLYETIHKAASIRLLNPSDRTKAVEDGDGLGWVSAASALGQNYTLQLAPSHADLTGEITARTIVIDKITVASVFKDTPTPVDRSKTNLNVTDSSVTLAAASKSVVSGDTVTIDFTTAYTGTQTATEGDKDLAHSADAWTVSGIGQHDDYTVTFPANITGNVGEKDINGISVDPSNMKVEYKHGETLDLTGAKVTVSFSNSGVPSETYEYGTYNGSTGWFENAVPTTGTVTALPTLPYGIEMVYDTASTPAAAQDDPMRYDDTKFVGTDDNHLGNIVFKKTVSSTDVGRDTVQVKVKRMPIDLTATGSVTKTYNGIDTLTNAEKNSLTFAFDTTKVAIGDTLAVKIDDINNIKYYSKNAHNNTGVADPTDVTDTTVKRISFPAITAFKYTDSSSDNYIVTLINKTTSEITKADLEVDSIVKKPVAFVEQYAATDEVTEQLSTGDVTWVSGKEPVIVSGVQETVELEYTYTWSTGTPAANNNYTDISVVTTPAEKAPHIIDATQAGNYNLTWKDPSNGIVKNREIQTLTATAINLTPEHGDQLNLDNAAFRIQYKGITTPVDYKYTAGTGWTVDATGSGTFAPVTSFPTNISFGWTKELSPSATPSTDPFGSGYTFDDDETVYYDQDDNHISNHTGTVNVVYYNLGTDGVTKVGGNKTVPIANVDVQQKTINKIVVSGTAIKDYDGKRDAAVTGLTFTPFYNDGTTDQAIGITRGGSAEDVKVTSKAYYVPTGTDPNAIVESDGTTYLTGVSSDYKLVFDTAAFDAAGTKNGNYKLAPTVDFTASTATGKIKQLDVTLKDIPAPYAVQKMSPTDPDDLVKSKKDVKLGTDSNSIKISDDDKAKMAPADYAGFKADYTIKYLATEVAAGASADTKQYDVSKVSITGLSNANNYKFTWEKVKGIVVPNAIEIKNLIPPTQMTDTIKDIHTDEIDLSGMKFTIEYQAFNGVNVPDRTFENIGGKWKVTYDDINNPGSTITDADADLTAYGVDIVWNNDGTTHTDEPGVGDILHRDQHDNRALTVKAASTDTTSPQYNGGYVRQNTTQVYSVDPLPIYAKATGTAIDKDYDGNADADKSKLTFAFYSNAAYTTAYDGGTKSISGSRTAIIGDKDQFEIDLDALTAEYEKTGSENAGKDVNWDGTSAQSKNIKLSNVGLKGTRKDNYTLTFIPADSALTGTINQAPLTVNVSSVPYVYTGSTVLTGTLANTTGKTYYTLGGKIAGDDVDAVVNYEYEDSDPTHDPGPMVDLTFASPALTGADANNYDPTLRPTSLPGSVQEAKVTSISVIGPTQKAYEHGDKADLTGMEVHLTRDDGTTPAYTYVDLGNGDEGWVELTGGPYTPSDIKGLPDDVQIDWVDNDTKSDVKTTPANNVLRHDEHNDTVIRVSSGSATPAYSTKFTVDPKTLYVGIGVNGSVSKTYDGNAAIGDDASDNANLDKLTYKLIVMNDDGTFSEYTSPIGGEDIDVKKATAASFAGPDVRKVSGVVTAQDFTPTGFGLDGASFTAGNYQLATLNNGIVNLDTYLDPAKNWDDPLTGTINPLKVTLKADENNIPSINEDAADKKVTIPYTSVLTDDTTTSVTMNGVTVTWEGTYDVATKVTDPTTHVTTAQVDTKTTRTATGTGLDNYEISWTPDTVNGVITAKKATNIVINTQPKFVTDPKPTHGDVLEPTDWEGFEYTVTYTGSDTPTTKHKIENGTWKTDGGYTAPDPGTTFTWNDGTPANDIPTNSVIRKDKDNTVTIAIDDQTKPTNTVEANPKKVKLEAAADYERQYNGGVDITGVTFTIPASELVAGDRGVNVETAPSVEFKTPDVEKENSTIKNKDLKVSGTPVLSDPNYEIEKDADGNYVYTEGSNFKARVIPKEIKVEITVPTIESGGATDASGTISYNTTPDTKNGSFVTENENDIVANEKANLKLTYAGKRDTVTNTGTAAADTNVTLDPAIPTITGDNIKSDNYTIVSATATGSINPAKRSTGGGGGGGGSSNSLTIHYENEDGTAGEEVSKITVPLGTDPTDLIGVIKTKIKDMTVLWTSDNEKVATVDENGVVTYVGEGKATITAQSKQTKSLKDTVVINVTAEEVKESPAPSTSPAPTTKPSDGGSTRTHERIKDSLITKTMLNPYIVGYDDYVFGPELPISREELAAIFARLIANNLYMDQNYDTSFPDVPEKWSKSYIGYLEGFDVVTGYEDGTFKPEQNITRAEMAVMMAKAEGYDITPDIDAEEAGFPDVDEGYATWSAAKAIQILSDLGIMSGYTDGTFRPGQPITRAETVATVNRVLAAQEVADREVLPSDVTDAHWAYEDIVFAMNHRILKDTAADPNAFIWSEEFDKNMIRTTEKVSGTKETTTE